jgi:hypothetical protein
MPLPFSEPHIARQKIDRPAPGRPKPARTWNPMPEMKDPQLKRGMKFFRYRRQYVSNKTWYGTACVIAGLLNLSFRGGWLQLIPSLLLAAGGGFLVWSGVWRALHRIDPATGAPRPSPPW